FIEAIREPERFAAALDRAAALGKPVVMVKVGRHERTRRAITTHTGGDADDSAAVSTLLRAHGAIEVADIVELAETLAAFQTAQRPAGRRAPATTSAPSPRELTTGGATRPKRMHISHHSSNSRWRRG